jgi:heme exporter protein A
LTDSALSLELTDVGLSRGGRVLASGLSFALAPGQLALVTGPNGSGKTTLLRTIAGLSLPVEGSIRLGGQKVSSLDSDGRGQVTFQAHLEGLKNDLTVDENISFYSVLRDSPKNNHEYMTELGLDAVRARQVRNLSAGQRRRVTLAILAALRTKLWLLDEPLTNLDASGRALVARWLARHLAQGGLAVIATHLAAELERPGCLLVEL